MYTSKLFKYLDVVRKDEWKPLRHFMIGSINEGTDAFRLFDYIYGYRKNLASDKLRIDLINKDLFPHLSRKSFQNILSVLNREIEDFWIWTDLNEDKARKELHRLEALNKRGMYAESDKSLARIEKITNNNTNLDLWNDYYKSRARFDIFFSNNPWKENQEMAKEILSTSILSLNSFTANILLYYKAELRNRILVKGETWEDVIAMIERLKLSSESTKLNESLKNQVLLLNSDYATFPRSLYKLIRYDSVNISETLNLTYFYHTKRYLILQVRKGNKSLTTDLFKLIQWSLDSGLMLYNGELSVNYFVSDLNTLCALNEIEKAKLYQSKFLDKLNAKYRVEAQVLGSMMINFVEANLDIVIDLYVNTKFVKVSRRLQAAGIFLRASYIKYGKDIDYFSYHIRNVSDFIRRNKNDMTAQQVQAWKNFMFILNKMTIGTEENKLLKLLDESTDIIHRKWLQRVIKEGVNE